MAVVSKGALYLSQNGGASWETPETPGKATCVTVAEPGNARLFLGCEEGKGLFASADIGKTWQPVCPLKGRITYVAVDNADATRVLTYMTRNPGGTGSRREFLLLLSEDGGETWTQLFNRSLDVWWLQDIAFDPFSSDRIYVSTYWGGAAVAERVR